MKSFLMQSENIRAYGAGRKTETRRIIWPQPDSEMIEGCKSFLNVDGDWVWMEGIYPLASRRPKLTPGETFYLRETYFPVHLHKNEPRFAAVEGDYFYKADYDFCKVKPTGKHPWSSPMMMPQKAARYFPTCTGIDAQLLQSITPADAIAEGIQSFTKDGQLVKYWPCDPCDGDLKCAWADLPRSPIQAYRTLWNSINLPPKPVYGNVFTSAFPPYDAHDESTYAENQPTKRTIIGYRSFPWSTEDFEAKYIQSRTGRRFKQGFHTWKNKPLTVIPNPWVWRIQFTGEKAK